jgi:hypothetical protein
MPDSLRGTVALRDRRPQSSVSAITAAAAAYTPATWREGQLFGNRAWQYEAWNFRRTLGEFNQAIDWESRAMSRIRLGCAEIVPGADEPEMLRFGVGAQLLEDFCGGPPGHSAFLRAITPQLLIPGEGWLIAERDDPRLPLSSAEWGVYSSDCIQALGDRFRIQIGPSIWRDLAPDNLPMRIYEPDPQYPWLATSNAEAAVPIMRRIFLIDSRIVAMMVSRLVMNGLMLIPQEGTFSVPDQYKQAPDPFVAMLIDIASKNIANPGLASAGIPIPVRFTAELIDKWKILKADDPLDEWLLKERLDELGRLGDTLGIARERVTGGMGEQNHWGSWQASEEEIRITFSPLAETICGAVTKAYLAPMLRAAGVSPIGPNGGRLIAWYDVSELTARPDKSAQATTLYRDGVINEVAYRRESGFDESDALLDDNEIETWAYKRMIVGGTAELVPSALAGLTGETPVGGVAPAPAASGGGAASETSPGTTAPPTGPPSTIAEPPPPPGGAPPMVSAARTLQRVLTNVGAIRPVVPVEDVEHVNGSSRGR